MLPGPVLDRLELLELLVVGVLVDLLVDGVGVLDLEVEELDLEVTGTDLTLDVVLLLLLVVLLVSFLWKWIIRAMANIITSSNTTTGTTYLRKLLSTLLPEYC